VPTDRELLIRQLQGAYSGERAAVRAYRGHWKSVRDPEERARIQEIEREEHHHRELVGGLLRQLGAKPNALREALFFCIGHTIALLCRIGGWFIPMYGAGKLERGNIVEYEEAAVYAARCGHEEMVECLLTMAEVEWEHERYFREKVAGHWILNVFKIWEAPPAKESIRGSKPAALPPHS
jgi:rubrerythrin